jgi:hypothetical protein
MKLRQFWFALTLVAVNAIASTAHSAVEPLSDLVSPTVQTLINLGSNGVSVGDEEFSNFSMVNALPNSGVTASQIQVQPYSVGGNGLQFVSSWFAANGTYVDEVLSFNVQAINPTRPITMISLLSNGTAPAPAPGTFTTDTLVSLLVGGGTAAPVITTYNDGIAAIPGNASSDVNYAQTTLVPQTELQISDTIFESSSASVGTDSGGVATESILQNVFVDANVPEPNRSGWICLPLAAVVATNRRVRRRPAGQ